MIRRRRRRTRSIRGTGEADRSRGRLPRWEPAPPELRPPASCGSPRRRARSERKPQHCEELGPPALDPRTRRRLGREPTPRRHGSAREWTHGATSRWGVDASALKEGGADAWRRWKRACRRVDLGAL